MTKHYLAVDIGASSGRHILGHLDNGRLVLKEIHRFENKLRERGVFVPPAVYPAVPKNKARLRFCVISEHQPEQIVQALNALVELAKELGIQLPQKTV